MSDTTTPSMSVGTKVRLVSPKDKKHRHPWRRKGSWGRKPIRGKGVIEEIRDVMPSDYARDGRVYYVRLSKFTIKPYTIIELEKILPQGLDKSEEL